MAELPEKGVRMVVFLTEVEFSTHSIIELLPIFIFCELLFIISSYVYSDFRIMPWKINSKLYSPWKSFRNIKYILLIRNTINLDVKEILFIKGCSDNDNAYLNHNFKKFLVIVVCGPNTAQLFLPVWQLLYSIIQSRFSSRGHEVIMYRET